MKYEKGTFILIPNKHQLRTLSLGARVVFQELCDFADQYGRCFPSRRLIAKHIQMSENSVDRYIVELVNSGFIEKTNRTSMDGGFTSNEYQLLVLPLPTGGDTPLPTHGDTPLPTGGELTVSSINSNKPGEVETSPLTIVSEEEKPTKPERRTKDKEAIYRIFSPKIEPWHYHKQEKEAALRLFDLVGVQKVRRGKEIMRENIEDPMCPQASTPFEYERKLPKLKRYAKKLA